MHAQLTFVPPCSYSQSDEANPILSSQLSVSASLGCSFVHVTITLISREIFHLFLFIYLLSYCSFFSIELLIKPNNQILLFVQIINSSETIWSTFLYL